LPAAAAVVAADFFAAGFFALVAGALFFFVGDFFAEALLSAGFAARDAVFFFFGDAVPVAAERELVRTFAPAARGAAFAAVFFFAGDFFAARAAVSAFRAVPPEAGFFAEVLLRDRAAGLPESAAFALRAEVFFLPGVAAADDVTRLDVFFREDELLRAAVLEVFLVATCPEPPGNERCYGSTSRNRPEYRP